MRQFSGGGLKIWNLGREAKVVYTCFLVMSSLAFASSFALVEDMIGDRGTASYYGVARGPAEGGAPHGPSIEVPEEELRPVTTVAMPYRKLLEVAHFHLFTVPVFLLIVTHLFMLTGAAPRAKLSWILLAWSTALLHITAPFVVRYGGAGFGWVFPTSGICMAVPLAVVSLYPVWAMWRPPSAST